MDAVKCTWGVLVLIVVAGCAKATPSNMADQIKVCGKQYQYPETVVKVEKTPQWVVSSPYGCAAPSPLSPQPKIETAQMSDPFIPPRQALTPVVAVLQGLPRFSASIAPAAAPIPFRPQAEPRPVKPVESSGDVAALCKDEAKPVRTVIHFESGSAVVAPGERTKLVPLVSLPVSYFQIDGYADRSGLLQKNEGLAMRRAQSVATMLSELSGKVVPTQVTGRAGCCFKETDVEPRRVEVTAMVTKPCLTPVKSEARVESSQVNEAKGGRLPMAK